MSTKFGVLLIIFFIC